MKMYGLTVQPETIKDDLVLFRTPTHNRNHHYKRTYAKRMFHCGNRKFVIWQGMICWLRNAYRGHYVVWTMQAPGTVVL